MAGHHEAAGCHVAVSAVQQTRGRLVLSAPVAQQDQRAGIGAASGCPEHAVDIAEDEEVFRDAVSGRLRSEAHGFVAFRDALRAPPRPPVSDEPDNRGRWEHPAEYSGNGSHLLGSIARETYQTPDGTGWRQAVFPVGVRAVS